ncbi:hypothetical protein FSPOR_11604 [Fusarium sporotrichioides]|uniref:Uncharacterized protein n=1 Tax=Fusarium sporotrichioides TaxID=5514 RepID=A0A395RFW9_FUSSP|nr:hypothetical protein FSPOR_11604 [Fusarium sporotrichioides]
MQKRRGGTTASTAGYRAPGASSTPFFVVPDTIQEAMIAGLDDDNQLATTARATCLRLTDKETQYDRYNPVSVCIVYNLLGDSSQANTIDPAIQPSGIAHLAPVLDPFTQTGRQPEADKAVANNQSAGGVTVTQVHSQAPEHFTHEQVKSEMQPWISDQIQSATGAVKGDVLKHFNGFKVSLEPWINEKIEYANAKQMNEEKAREARFKRDYEAFKKSQQGE